VTDRHSVDDLEIVGEVPPGLRLDGADVGGCRFVGLDLTETSLRAARLTECRFERCEMTLVDLTDAQLHEVTFETCRLRAVDFGALARDPVGASVRYEDCDLGLASFRDLDLRQCVFEGGQAHEATFRGCDLRGVAMRGLDLRGAELDDCDLRETDLRGSRAFVFSPCRNRVRGLRVDAPEALDLLAALGVRWD
jgi:fluoroquinolone resistance protein